MAGRWVVRSRGRKPCKAEAVVGVAGLQQAPSNRKPKGGGSARLMSRGPLDGARGVRPDKLGQDPARRAQGAAPPSVGTDEAAFSPSPRVPCSRPAASIWVWWQKLPSLPGSPDARRSGKPGLRKG